MTQERALEIMLRGDNVMLTGSAGSGKTYLLNKFIEMTHKKKRVAITATTGIAATHLRGSTIHAWSGIGVAEYLPSDFIYTMGAKKLDDIRRTATLIIDEISMMHDYILEVIDKSLRLIRNSDKPFGGIQVILCGDFYQLPPVSKDDYESFVVDSRSWDEMNLSVCYLEKQYRAKDVKLQEILNAMRDNTVEQKHVDWLKTREVEPPDEDITVMYTTNKNVERLNSERLAEINEDSHYFLRTSTGTYGAITGLQKSVLAPEILELKVGAVVMTLKNDPGERYVNGSTGRIIDFEQSQGLPVVQFDDGKTMIIEPQTWEQEKNNVVVASITQLPLRLAYAITVHKSQGMTLDRAVVDLSRAFVAGQGYVALSRVGSLDSLYIKGLNKMALKISPRALAIDKELRRLSKTLT